MNSSSRRNGVRQLNGRDSTPNIGGERQLTLMLLANARQVYAASGHSRGKNIVTQTTGLDAQQPWGDGR